MSFRMIAFLLMHFLFSLFVSISVYKIFVKYRYNEMIKINLDNMKNIDDSNYICGFDSADLKKTLPVCVCISVVFVLIQNTIIFNGEPFYVLGPIKANSFISCIALIVMYIFPGLAVFYVIRNYKTHGAEYHRFLFWECFMYKGKKLKPFWDDPKYRKNTNITISKFDVIAQADHEKKWAKICIFVMTPFLMIVPFAESVGYAQFDREKIIISYSEYDYDDIVAIYDVSPLASNSGQNNGKPFAAVVFSDGRVFRKYPNNNPTSNERFIDIVAELSQISPVSCAELPNN